MGANQRRPALAGQAVQLTGNQHLAQRLVELTMWTIIEQDKPQIELPVIDEALELESSARPTRPGRELSARRILGTTLSLLAALCLLLAIPVQLLLFRPQLLAAYPAFYDWLETTCIDRCPFQLPTRVDPETSK